MSSELELNEATTANFAARQYARWERRLIYECPSGCCRIWMERPWPDMTSGGLTDGPLVDTPYRSRRRRKALLRAAQTPLR